MEVRRFDNFEEAIDFSKSLAQQKINYNLKFNGSFWVIEYDNLLCISSCNEIEILKNEMNIEDQEYLKLLHKKFDFYLNTENRNHLDKLFEKHDLEYINFKEASVVSLERGLNLFFKDTKAFHKFFKQKLPTMLLFGFKSKTLLES